jgi:hypothetical protein
MVMRDMSFDRLHQLRPAVARELRPALAHSDPPVPPHDGGPPSTATGIAHPVRPAEIVCPAVHGKQSGARSLAIRFRNVARGAASHPDDANPALRTDVRGNRGHADRR